MTASLVIPRHVAIVMDGNGRWAKARQKPRLAGHRAGATAVRHAIKFCLERKIPALTLFALSTDNRERRPLKEVDWLLKLFHDALDKHTKELHEHGVRIRVVGDMSGLPNTLKKRIAESETLTQDNTCLQLSLAINYSGRWDILQATQKLANLCGAGVYDPATIDEKTFQEHLSFSDLPEPDLMIRTSQELRISNFMLWQLAYTEFYFTPVLWPDFNETVFNEALLAFSKRSRRFGHCEQPIDESEEAYV